MENQPEVQTEGGYRQDRQISPCLSDGMRPIISDERTPSRSAGLLHHARVLYAAFDAYPGLKGAQAHIRANLRALTDGGGRATLLCLGPGGSFRDPDSGAMVYAFATGEQNMLRRSELFGRFLTAMADTMIACPPPIIHFRDIWSGMPFLSHEISRQSKLVFEVNGLPSVELPSHYPRLAGNTPLLSRLRRMEDECLTRCDRVITVCRRTASYLARRGCDEGKITVIPNAAGPSLFSETLHEETDILKGTVPEGRKVILYVGTLAPWQGLYILLEAISHLGHRSDFSLVVAASNKKGVARFRKQVAARGMGERVTVLSGVRYRGMLSLYRQAYLSVAPLARGARNELQGCCPLKIVESMACCIPVVASDLPVVREMVCSGDDGVLVPPGSPRALARALDMLMGDEALRDRLARGAREKAQRAFAAGLLTQRLGEVYTLLREGGKE